ncbi:MAG: iron-sulfur cluster repair di-iron protein [Candidatus Eisenbacteria bacterium]|nr:iron-sulfur cluster repair di-iron protein [Candidatus Eisenbacteria bacterium]
MNTTQKWMEQTVGQLVTERPGRARIFESLGIDYCCGGRRRLDTACESSGVSADTVMSQLEAEYAGGVGAEPDPSRLSMTALCDQIERTHHTFLRNELPHLQRRMEKVAEKHGPRDPRLLELQTILRSFTAEIGSHMMKEEEILFPLIRSLEAGTQPAADRAACCSVGVSGPIRVMEAEHEHAGEALARMRVLTDNFTPSPSACQTHQALLSGLADLERDMHRHVHKENNILFPRAVGRREVTESRSEMEPDR